MKADNGVGMLWFDPSGDDLQIKVIRAADFYAAKYGRRPTLAYVNPKDHPGGQLEADGVDVQPNKVIMRQHFWLGYKKGDP